MQRAAEHSAARASCSGAQSSIAPSAIVDTYGILPYKVAEETTMPPATARLEARISAELHATLKRAAELQDRTVTDFVIAAVQDAAQRAIEKAGVVALSLADQQRFAQALSAPPPPNAALKRAFARRRKLVAPD